MDLLQCTISKIINPGQYILVSQDREHCSEIEHLENLLTKEMLCMEGQNHDLHLEMNVAVRFPSENIFKRGLIKKKTGNAYEVFLVDYGKLVEVEKTNILPTISLFNEIQPLSFSFRLFGVMPTRSCLTSDSKRQKLLENWSDESLNFVQKFLCTSKNIFIKTNLMYGKTTFGDILIEQKSQTHLSLTKQLLIRKYCAYSVNYFLKAVFLTDNLEQKYETASSKGTLNDTSENQENIQDSQKYISNTVKEIFKKKSTTTLKENTEQLREINIGRGKKLILPLNEDKEKNPGGLSSDFHHKNGSCSNDEMSISETNMNRLTSSAEKRKNSHRKKSSGRINLKNSCNNNNNNNNEINSFEDFKSSLTESDLSDIFFVDNPMIEYLPMVASAQETEETVDETMENNKDSECSEKYIGKRKPPLMKFTDPIILYHDSVVQPVYYFKHLELDISIIQNLRKCGRFDVLSSFQQWAIPVLLTERNAVLIGSAKTGKTLSYAIFLINFIKKVFDEASEGNGPLAIVLCSSSQVAEFVYAACNCLLGNFTGTLMECLNISVVLALGEVNKDVMVKLTNGCHILISTPHCMVRLLEMPLVTNLERLSCLILDEIETISTDPFKSSVRIILEKVQYGTQKRFCQKIFCGRKWTPGVESLAKSYLKVFTLIFGVYSEAAVYARLKPFIYLVDSSHKEQILLEKIRDKIGEKKILIMCETTSEVLHVSDYLQRQGVECLVAHENTLYEVLKDLLLSWKSSKSRPMITTDDVLFELKLGDVEVLVHYNITSNSRTNFFYRYGTILGNCERNNENTQDNIQENRSEKTDIILVDDDKHYQLPHIIDFVVRLGGKVSPVILQKCDEIRRQIEVSKESSICGNLLMLGRCRKYKECKERHALVKVLDSPAEHPVSGWVTFEVITVHNVCSFSIKLLEHIDVSGKKTTIKHDNRVPELLRKFYAVEENRDFRSVLFDCCKSDPPLKMPAADSVGETFGRTPSVKTKSKLLASIKIGSMCSIQFFEEFVRAEILKYTQFDKYNKPSKVVVRLVDEGIFREVETMELFELSEELAAIPPRTVDAKLLGIQPLDFDISWSQVATNYVKSLLTKELTKEQYWIGKIGLALKNLLFLQSVKLKHFLPNVKIEVTDFDLHKKLLTRKIAILNEYHMPTMLKLCEEADISIPKEDFIKKQVVMKQPQWAFFDKDFVRVIFRAAENTSTIFLSLKKFSKLLTDLENCCQEYGEKRIKAMKKEKPDKLLVGMFCLALYEERWNRGRIESEDETTFYIYFVDYGDFHVVNKENVIDIPENLLTRLPCQAIECSLLGVEAENSQEVLDVIYDFSNDGTDDLYAHIRDKDLKPEITGGRKYSVNLLSFTGKSLNKYLTEQKIVPAVEAELEFAENVDEIEVSDDETDSWESEDWDERSEELKDEGIGLEIDRNKDGADLADYFNELPPDAFENEDELMFLKEFSKMVFPKSSQPSTDESQKTAGFECESANVRVKKNKTDFNPKINFKQLLYQHKKFKEKIVKLPELRYPDNVLTPQVLWTQDSGSVQLKIILSNVEKYRFDSTITNILFRCILDEKTYSVDLKLFGAVNPKMSTVTLKTFHVLIKLRKLCFLPWPRLLRDDGKNCWLKADVDKIEEQEDLISKRIELAKQNIQAGILKEAVRFDKIYSYSDSDESEASADSSE